MKTPIIAGLIAIAAPSTAAEGFRAEQTLAIAACQLAIKANQPGTIRWLGHEIYS
jgi:hypothetical protein